MVDLRPSHPIDTTWLQQSIIIIIPSALAGDRTQQDGSEVSQIYTTLRVLTIWLVILFFFMIQKINLLINKYKILWCKILL